MPKYFTQVYRLPISEIGLYSALPNIFPGITSVGFGFVISKLVRDGKWSVLFTRRLCQSVATFGSSVFMALAGFAAQNSVQAVICLCLAQCCYGGVSLGV